MKKVTAIFFACLVLFNALGFYAILVGIKYERGLALESRLDREQYDMNETVTLKFPMALPYHQDSESYDRVDGKVEHDGEFYRLVKQRLSKDTLYIVCIKDHDGKRIAEALSDYVKTYTDKPGDAKQSLKNFNFIKDFLPTAIHLQSASTGWNHDVSYASAAFYYSSIPATHASPPPRG
ncbi:MAG TPA: hypothetical protein VK658_23365 [Chryseolinea sp.]|nr:hypothetical protein [Chryseolinea sp.]